MWDARYDTRYNARYDALLALSLWDAPRMRTPAHTEET
jgi:hypothetical protein